MFAVSKVAGYLATPSNLLVILALLGALAGARRWGRRLCLASLLLLAFLGLAPAGFWLLLPLENRFPAFGDDSGSVAGVIVLGGAVHPNTGFARGQLVVGDAAERVIAMADLARRYPQARIVFSGGNGALIKGGKPEADAVERFAPTLGIEASRIIFENRSRTTAENAGEVRRLVTPQPGERWLLVTSAWHMPRAMGVFRAVGFAVTPYPVDYRSGARSDLLAAGSSMASSIDRFDLAVREWVGLVIYRLSGRSEALFPGPSSPSPVGPDRVSAGPIR
ncbi:YdcF family protein [uncultured Enterovirga sp.]|uniref:YdcF family protein n=1 Tax=uncultured Enterovirga sp. TaxID=2026352 RepID=UPI0035CCA2C5